MPGLDGILWIDLPARKLTLAVCYFSPASSRLYSSGALDAHPCSVLWHGLKTATRSRNNTHQCIVLGDFNTRIGTMDDDVPNLHTLAISPQHAESAAHHFVNTYSHIPSRRQNMDTRVPDREAALQLLHGLNTVECVVLNGRATGDEHGHCTFVRKGDDGHVSGSSTIDFAIVSASLYNSVQRLTIHDHQDDSVSRDHCPMSLQLALRPALTADAHGESHRRQRVYRPVGAVNIATYCDALSSKRDDFQMVLHEMQQRAISIEREREKLHPLRSERPIGSWQQQSLTTSAHPSPTTEGNSILTCIY